MPTSTTSPTHGDADGATDAVAAGSTPSPGRRQPPSAADLRAELRRIEGELDAVLATVDADLLSPSDAAALAEDAERLSRRATAARVELLSRAAAAGALIGRDGRALSPERWAAGQLGISPSQAARDIRTGDRLRHATGTRDAFRAGKISADQARQVAEAVELAPGKERSLLDTAQRTPGQLAGRCRDIKATAAGREGLEARNARHHRQRRLVRSETDDLAARVELVMPALDGARFDALVQPFTQLSVDQARAEGRDEPAAAVRLDAALLALEYGNAAFHGHALPGPSLGPPLPRAGRDRRSGSAADRTSGASKAGTGRPSALPGLDEAAGLDDRTDDIPSGELDHRPVDDRGTEPLRSLPTTGDALPATRSGRKRRRGRRPDTEPEPDDRTPRSGRTTRWGGHNAEVIWRVDEAALRRGYPLDGERMDLQVNGAKPVPVTPDDIHDALHDDPRVSFVLLEGTDIKRIVRTTHDPSPLQRAALRALHDRCADTDCRSFGHLEVDHLVPFARGGRTTLDNLAPLCGPTHDAKTHRGRQLHRVPGSQLVTAHPEPHAHTAGDASGADGTGDEQGRP